MQETMNPVEVEQAPHLDGAEEKNEVDRLLTRIHVGDELIGISPQHQNFVGGPDGAAADAAPENVVAELIAPQELAFPGGHPFRSVLVLQALGFGGPESDVPCAHYEDEHHLVANVDFEYPVKAKIDGSREIWPEIEPGQSGDSHVDDIPGKKVVVEPFQKLERPGGPQEQRVGRSGATLRLPESPSVARHPVDQFLPFCTHFFHSSPPEATGLPVYKNRLVFSSVLPVTIL